MAYAKQLVYSGRIQSMSLSSPLTSGPSGIVLIRILKLYTHHLVGLPLATSNAIGLLFNIRPQTCVRLCYICSTVHRKTRLFELTLRLLSAMWDW